MGIGDFICSRDERIDGRVYGHVFPLLLLRKYAGK